MGRAPLLAAAVLAALLAMSCAPVQQSPQTRSSPSHATATCGQVGPNLELIHLKGAPMTNVIRDISDIEHPRTVVEFDAGPATFVTAREVSYLRGPSIMVRSLCGAPQTFVEPPHGLYASAVGDTRPYAWTPDGKSVAYVTAADTSTRIQVSSGGPARVLATLPLLTPTRNCLDPACAEQSNLRLLYSPSGAYLSLVQNLGGPSLRVWSADGKLLASGEGETDFMSVWSGEGLYFRDDKGVEVWRAGVVSTILGGVAWIRPTAAPTGGLIAFAVRDSAGASHVQLLDTVTGHTREIAASRSDPAFLNSHLLWYREERPCRAVDNCTGTNFMASGKTFIYDLQDNTETESLIQDVLDAWPHQGVA